MNTTVSIAKSSDSLLSTCLVLMLRNDNIDIRSHSILLIIEISVRILIMYSGVFQLGFSIYQGWGAWTYAGLSLLKV